MYGNLLIIAKILSDALSAAFGMLGLLSTSQKEWKYYWKKTHFLFSSSLRHRTRQWETTCFAIPFLPISSHAILMVHGGGLFPPNPRQERVCYRNKVYRCHLFHEPRLGLTTIHILLSLHRVSSNESLWYADQSSLTKRVPMKATVVSKPTYWCLTSNKFDRAQEIVFLRSLRPAKTLLS
jgi:hypothetical protein